ncbi:OLC1v1002591C1 [Oldenlandia corymbosa var. corymbosa]|uniref:OLC1v1002591C1 n=1 Tax=Oldenlandia corymbosa var. corymbosa TaxID=529605 RepID=A0AAV1DAG2_OLDCO|nr:OLC1v1002591C1 [Oldenlandia corymbosa var. corymbosa]
MMKMNGKAGKSMKGFGCRAPAATAVCMASEPLSVIVKRRRSIDRSLSAHARLINTSKYTRLAESGAHDHLSSDLRRSVTLLPSFKDRSQQTQIVSSSAPEGQVFQVVVMRVSLHCQGCAGKLKKYLSKMEGVTSFSIDLESKRVTVMGHVSPLGLVESISKVKRAELWPSPSASS